MLNELASWLMTLTGVVVVYSLTGLVVWCTAKYIETR